MSVYNLIWADDEIDDFLDKEYESDLKELGLVIIGKARDGIELEKVISEKSNIVDAVIVDANFNEASGVTNNERDITGLQYARSLYIHKYNRKIPFFLYTNRTEEMLRDINKDNPSFLDDFPRHIRWFAKYLLEERNEMFDAIKNEVDKRNSTSFIVRNRYQNELNASSLINGGEDLVFEFLSRDIEGELDEMVEPFVRIRRTLEKMFALCESMNIIPPISQDTNGTARYFLKNEYSVKDKLLGWKPLYKMNNIIMAKPLAQSLDYIIDVTQDGAHSKMGLRLDIDKYFEDTKDVLLLRSVASLFIDIIKWFALFLLAHNNIDQNRELWEKVN